jgi:hypothetical protein
MACSKVHSDASLLSVPEWKPPAPGYKSIPRFFSTIEKFAYNNFSSSEVEAHNHIISEVDEVHLIEVEFPFGILTVSVRDKDTEGGFPVVANAFKTDKDANVFLTKKADFVATFRKSANSKVYRAVFTEQFIGTEWDMRCLGVAVTYGFGSACLRGRLRACDKAELGVRSPLCSFMIRKCGVTKSETHKLGKRDRTGLPISAIAIGTHMFFALGTYSGVGFGNDLTGCEEMIELMSTLNDRKGRCWQSFKRYAKLYDTCYPFSGAACNVGSIAYVAGVSFHGDEDTRLMVTGVWGDLLKALARCHGVECEIDGAVVSRRFIRADDYDKLYSESTFMLVGCLEYITSAMAGELIETIQMPGGISHRIGNDIGLFQRNGVNVRRR